MICATAIFMIRLLLIIITLIVYAGVDKSYSVVDCKFYVYGNVTTLTGTTEYQWVLVGTSTRSTYTYDALVPVTVEVSSLALLRYYTVYVDTTQFKNGPVQLKVVTDTTTAGALSSVLGATVSNYGRSLCYSVSDLGGLYGIPQGSYYPLTVQNCSTDAAVNVALMELYTITSVSFYEESVTGNKVTSSRLSTATKVPYSFYTGGSVLQQGNRTPLAQQARHRASELDRLSRRGGEQSVAQHITQP